MPRTPARAGRVRSRPSRCSLVLALALIVPRLAWSQSAPDWATLPELETELRSGSTVSLTLRVGDRIKFRVKGLNGLSPLPITPLGVPGSGAPGGTPESSKPGSGNAGGEGWVAQYLPDPVISPESFASAPQGASLGNVVGNAPSAGEKAAAPQSLRSKGWELFQYKEGAPAGEIWLDAVVLKPGEVVFPRLAIRDPAGNWRAKTRELNFSAVSAINSKDPKPTEAEPLVDPIGLPFPWWVIIAGSVVIALVLGVGIWYLIRVLKRWKKKPVPVAAKPVVPEDVRALEAIARLLKSGAVEQNEYKKIFHGLSEIIKAYLGERYGIDALESTSRELRILLEGKTPCPPEWIAHIADFYDRLDPVKFSDTKPTSEDISFVFSRAQEIVRATRREGVNAIS